MLALMMASFAMAASGPSLANALPPKKAPTRYCRDMNNASSRLYSVKVCKTRAEWRRWESCHGSVTRYCAPTKKAALSKASLGRTTAFPLNEDSRIICRLLRVTGTRIVTEQVCLPKREWDRMWAESAEGLRDRQGDHSKLNRGVR